MSVKQHETHTHQHHHEKHTHEGSCNHEHQHGKLPVILYGLGLVVFMIGLIFEKFTSVPNSVISIIYGLSVISAGYHVILEGFGETWTNSRRLRKFHPNIHVLMALAAFGAMVIGHFQEAALLIVIFAGAHFLEDYAHEKSKKEINSNYHSWYHSLINTRIIYKKITGQEYFAHHHRK